MHSVHAQVVSGWDSTRQRRILVHPYATGLHGPTRDSSPRQLPTNHDHDGGPCARSTNIRVINRRHALPRPLTTCAWVESKPRGHTDHSLTCPVMPYQGCLKRSLPQNMGQSAQTAHPDSDRKNSTCRPPTNAEGRPTQRFFSMLLGESVALGEDACHLRHVLGSPGA
jgi:hypothetical protein